MLWIQLYTNLPRHPKTYALADALKIENAHAVGLMACLWCWAMENAVDGSLNGCSPRAIAENAGWRKKPDIFLNALISVGWVDQEEGAGLRLHDFEEYSALMINREEERRARKAEQMRDYRAKKAAKRKEVHGANAPDKTERVVPTVDTTHSDYSNSHVAARAPLTLPNPTLPNLTIPTYQVPTDAADGVAITNHPDRELLAGYFEQNCHKMRTAPLIGGLERALTNGLEPDLIRTVIDEVALNAPDRPAPYLLKILDSLAAEGVKTCTAYAARSAQRQQRREKSAKPGKFQPSEPPAGELADWEKQWLDEVKQRKAAQSRKEGEG